MQFRIPRLTAKLSGLDFDQQQNIFKTTEKFKKSKRFKNDCENNQATKMGSSMVIGSACKKSTIFGVNSGGEFALKISKCKVGTWKIDVTNFDM